MARQELDGKQLEKIAGGNVNYETFTNTFYLTTDPNKTTYHFTSKSDILSDFGVAYEKYPNDEVARDNYFLELVKQNNHLVK